MKLIKLTCLFLLLLICNYGCNLNDEAEIENQTSLRYTVKKISSGDAALQTKEISQIIYNFNKNSSRTGKNSFDFKLIEDEGLLIEAGDYNSFTFPILSESAQDLLLNLLISKQKDGTYNSYIVSYDLTDDEIERTLAGEKIELYNKIGFAKIDFDTDNLLGAKGDIMDAINSCPNGSCCEIVKEESQGTGWDIWVAKVVPCNANPDLNTGDNTPGGGGDSGGDNNTSDSNNNSGTGGGGGQDLSGSGNDSDSNDTCIDCLGDATILNINYSSVLIQRMGYYSLDYRARWINSYVNRETVKDMVSYLNRERNSSAAKERVDDIIESDIDRDAISAFPFVKYPEDKTAQYRRDYPKLTEYLENQLPKISDNPIIVNAFKQYTNMTDAQVRETLTWGDGPEIKIEQLNNDSRGNPIAGKFIEPDILKIDIDMVNLLENAESGSEFSEKLLFAIGVTILHEAVHFGDFTYNNDFWKGNDECLDEEGWLFEQEVYDLTIFVGASGNLQIIPLPFNCN